MSHLLYQAGNTIFATHLDELDEVLMPMHYQPIAGGPDFLLGVINLRRHLLPVVSVVDRLGLGSPADKFLLRSRILAAKVKARYLGFQVEQVFEIVDLSAEQLQEDVFAAPLHQACTGLVWRHKDQLVYELSLAEILANSQLKLLVAIDD